jgi:hypothetical protein
MRQCVFIYAIRLRKNLFSAAWAQIYNDRMCDERKSIGMHENKKSYLKALFPT